MGPGATMILTLFLASWAISSCGGSIDYLHPDSRPFNSTNKFSSDQSKLDHIFKERMPGLSTRSDIIRRDRADHNVVHRVVFVIRQRNMDKLIRILHDVSDPTSINYGLHLSRKEVLDMTSNTISRDSVVSFLRTRNVRVISETLGGEYIIAEAIISEWEQIFDTVFYKFHQTHDGSHTAEATRAEKYSIPRVLESHIEGVLNTVDMPLIRNDRLATAKSVLNRDGVSDALLLTDYGVVTPAKLKAYYNASMSSGSNKSTQAIFAAINQNYSPADLLAFQTANDLDFQDAMSVNGHALDEVCTSTPDNCIESNLDIQWMMATSQGSPTTHWYTDDFFGDWLISVANTTSPPLVLSISYGADEKYVTRLAHETFNTQAIKCGVMGITIFAASGDDGAHSSAVRGRRTEHCGYEPDFPAVSPYVTAVGATAGVEIGASEVVCSSATGHGITSGGGFSAYYTQPSWQQSAVSAFFANSAAAGRTFKAGYNASGRGYPDISLAGSMYEVILGGNVMYVSGTSASSPAVAGFFSSINAARFALGKGSLGWVNPALYAHADSIVTDVTSGSTYCAADGTCCPQGFSAAVGWDPASGLGSVNYGRLLSTFISLGSPINVSDAPPTFAPNDSSLSSQAQDATILVGTVVGALLFFSCLFAGIAVVYMRKNIKTYRIRTRAVHVGDPDAA